MTANADETTAAHSNQTAVAHSTETAEVCKHYSAQRTSNLDNSDNAVKWVCEDAEIRQVTFELPIEEALELETATKDTTGTETEDVIANANNLEKFHLPYSNVADN